MTTAATTAEFHVKVNAKQAQRELDATRASALTMGGALEKIDRSSMMAAKGVGALGPALGSLSRSSSEALRGIGDLAGMIGPGGGLAIGLTLAVGGAVKLYEAWKEYAENAKIAQQATDAIVPALNRMTDNALKPAEEAIRRMRKEIAELNTTLPQRDREAAAATVAQLEAQQEANKRNRARIDPSGRGFVDPGMVPVLKVIDERAEKLKTSLKSAKQAYEDLVAVDMQRDLADEERRQREAANKPAAAGRSGGPTSGAFGTRGDAILAVMKATRDAEQKDREEWAEMQWQEGLKEADRIRKREEDHQAYLVDLHRQAQAEMLRQAEEVDAKKAAMRETEKAEQVAFANAVGAGVGSALMQISNASIALASADAKSRKQLAVEMLSAEAVRAGGAISLKGAELVGTGVATMLGTAGAAAPLSLAQIGGGLALMTAGAAISIGGPKAVGALTAAIPAGIFGDTSGGGGRARDPGVNTRARRSMGRGQGEGGGLTQVFNYGVAGPTAEDQSREVVRRLRTGAEMRFT